MSHYAQLIDQMRALGLHGMTQGLEHQWSSSTYAELSFDQRLAHLLDGETGFRDRRRLARLLRDAKLKVQAQPEDIDYRPGRGLDRGYVADLLTCRWAEHQRNILITGPTGTGKTWLACALAVQAARNGYSVRYVRTSALLTDLALAHQDGSVVRLRQALAKVKVLVLDDFGLGALTPAGKQNLLDLLDDRIGATSTIVAGQLPVEEWFDYIAEPAVADAILDRLVHSSHRLKLVGESMRKLTASPIA
jgi:DNA replication protein DnaC